MKTWALHLFYHRVSHLAFAAVTVAIAQLHAEPYDYVNEVIADKPLVFYRFNDPAPADVAINRGSLGANGDGTHVNVTHRLDGAIVGGGSAATQYSGNGGRTVIPFRPELNPPANQPFTIEAWLKPDIDGLSNAQAPLFNRRSAGNRQGWVIFQRSATQGFNFRMYNENGSTQSIDITGGPYVIGEWTHLAVVWTGSTATLYVNGVQAGSQSGTYVANTESPFAAGAYGADSAGDNPFTGAMDEIAFYSSALSPATLLEHFQNGKNSPARTELYSSLVLGSNPVLYLPLDETDPNTDVAGNSGSLGVRGDAINFPGQRHQMPGALAGDADSATFYTGIDQSSTDGGIPSHVPFQPELNTPVFSVEAWLKPTINGTPNAQCPLFNRRESSPRTGWVFYQRDASVGWNCRMHNGVNTTPAIDITGGPYVVGEWCHVVATFDGSMGKLYVNGQLVASQTVVGAYAPNTDTIEFTVGGYLNGIENPFTGGIDEVALYPSALSGKQVLEHYQNGTDPSRSTPYEQLVALDGAVEYLRLNEPSKHVAANAGQLGSAANATYINAINQFEGPTAPVYTGLELDNLACLFNGFTGSVEIGNPPALNFAGEITVESWIKPDAVQGSQSYVVGHGVNDTLTSEVALRIQDGFYEFGTLAAHASFPATGDFGSGQWIHLVGTYDGTNWNIYRNGILAASAPDAGGATPVDNANWAIGARGRWKSQAGFPDSGHERLFTGLIDEVSIYDYALTPVRIARHFVSGRAGMMPLVISRANGQTVLTWSQGTLQQSEDLADYSDVPGAISPYVVPSGSPKMFYKLRF